ncbi:MAG: aminopeptidase [Clostridia bacterium]|nr:aminopeptidase [Clostridia bacterium]
MKEKNMEEKSKGQNLSEQLTYKKTNVYEKADEARIEQIYRYAEGYKSFLDAAKTEREAVYRAIVMAEAAGYTAYEMGEELHPGDLRYYNNRNKNLFIFRMGEEDLEKEGIRILAAHIDSPRLDLKQNPLYEDSGMGFLKTHYYGGIKKYQWTAIPLALHGVVAKADGTTVDVVVGEDESDPVFYVNDLLPHLAQDQMARTMATAIPGESLNILVGGLPFADEKVEKKIKLNILNILNEKYGITEEDFISAEISAVPAFRARDIGFDRAMIGAYGHDDRVCSYPAITAILETPSRHTVMAILADKEEIGSMGVTGMQNCLLKDMIDLVATARGANPAIVRARSICLSADVNAAYDPNFSEAYERRNSAMISCGTTMSKFTGSRGKSGTSDASAEFVGRVRCMFAENGVIWQTSELGKVDVGGGGTVAQYLANMNIDTVDLGVPVISMHAPYEVVSKADLYTTHEAFCAFIK